MATFEDLLARGTPTSTMRVPLADGETTIALRGLSGGEYRALEEKHPPTEAEVAESQAAGLPVPAFSSSSFPQALIAACMTDPQISEDQAHQLWDAWTPGDQMALFRQCSQLCTRPQIGALGKG